jgi:mannose-1-phosphate guanylyltransferase / phosphomannomutase
LDFDAVSHAERVGELVRAGGAHVGAVFDPDGEVLTLVDDAGHVLTATEATLTLAVLVAQAVEGATIALPVNVTSHAARLVEDAGGTVQWTKLSHADLLSTASASGAHLAADGRGGFAIPTFMPAFDAAATLVHLMADLALSGQRLSKLVASLPRTHVIREEVVTPWEAKGMVMRNLVERSGNREMLLVDGVKIFHEEGWVLVLPDPDEPITHVWAEGPSTAEARHLAQEYARRIRALL